MAGTVKVVVRDGWVVYDGKAQRAGGETVETDADTADLWESAGWVERVKATRKR